MKKSAEVRKSAGVARKPNNVGIVGNAAVANSVRVIAYKHTHHAAFSMGKWSKRKLFHM